MTPKLCPNAVNWFYKKLQGAKADLIIIVFQIFVIQLLNVKLVRDQKQLLGFILNMWNWKIHIELATLSLGTFQ